MAHTSWRLYITASQAGGNIAVGEIEMRATPAGADQCVGGAAIKSVEQPGLPATNAFDNNSATAWAANNTIPAWIGYTFPAPVNVTEVAITAWTDATFWSLAPAAFQLEYSDDAFATAGTVAYGSPASVSWATPGQTQLFTAGDLEAKKSQMYGVLGAPLILASTKKVMYVITGPGRQRIRVRLLKSREVGTV